MTIFITVLSIAAIYGILGTICLIRDDYTLFKSPFGFVVEIIKRINIKILENKAHKKALKSIKEESTTEFEVETDDKKIMKEVEEELKELEDEVSSKSYEDHMKRRLEYIKWQAEMEKKTALLRAQLEANQESIKNATKLAKENIEKEVEKELADLKKCLTKTEYEAMLKEEVDFRWEEYKKKSL